MGCRTGFCVVLVAFEEGVMGGVLLIVVRMISSID